MSDETNEVTKEFEEEITASPDFLDEDFDPAEPTEPSENKTEIPSEAQDKKTTERKAINVLATEFTLDIYRYASIVRSQGHATLADMIFRECMLINLAANTASNAIGRARFMKCLEDGFYASGNVMEYLKFVSLCGAGTGDNADLYERCETIHKIYAVSIKTASGKNRKNARVML